MVFFILTFFCKYDMHGQFDIVILNSRKLDIKNLLISKPTQTTDNLLLPVISRFLLLNGSLVYFHVIFSARFTTGPIKHKELRVPL